jgi:hypothetical protein
MSPRGRARVDPHDPAGWIDLTFPYQSIWIDGQPILEDGLLVGPAHLAKLAEWLSPRT